ncbi:MAG TPA: hypothetical protein VJ882_00825 [Desulfuromonadales bacterium]|nr:hypothetical protein [Desulfuromonadales bacterium]
MTTDALTLFARQLASWARQIIEDGRTPFRKVEQSPVVQTEQGPVTPPLVFWINRQSLMAGGILMLPENRPEENLEKAAACARSLGLRHFVSWAPTEIVFWEIADGDMPQRYKSIPQEGAEEMDIDRFRDELSFVLEELKLLSVTGSILPTELSQYYLANLCLGYLDASQDKLAETHRIARGQGQASLTVTDPEHWARRRGALSLFQLLALSYNDLLPDSVRPERLEQAMRLHLPELPLGLAPSPERDSHEDVPLPEDVAVLLHHLFRRLGQVGWRNDSDRALETVRLLLDHLAPCLGMHAIEDGLPPVPSAGPMVMVNSFGKQLPGEEIHLVGSAAALAGAALERNILELPPFAATAETPFETVIPAEKATLLLGSLEMGPEPAPRPVRRKLEDSLRRSWPTRRFALPPRTPAWYYSLLHLLGLAAPGSRINFDLDPSWLDRQVSASLFELLDDQFVLTSVKTIPPGRHRVSLLRKPAPASTIEVVGPHGTREVSADLSGTSTRSMVILALQLPDNLYQLIAGSQLQIPSEQEWVDLPPVGLRVFASSSLGRGLWQLVDGQRPQAGEEALAEKWRQSSCPLPPLEVLSHLQRLGGGEQDQKEIDGEVAFWLGTEIAMGDFAATPPPRARRRRSAVSADRNRLCDEISARVFVDGIPRFPEQYLFDYYRPELVDFHLSGPLEVASSFFNCVELSGHYGQRFEVEGDETAHALVLSSYRSPRIVSLPLDRKMTGEILQRYRTDLKQLRQQLVRETHSRVGDSKSANAIIEQIWENQEFPPWKLISEV